MAIKSKEKLAKLLGKKIKEVRLQKGISLKQFEVLENAIDRHSLSNIEAGKKLPSIYTTYRIAKVLEIDLIEFFKDLD
jgi:transcriptional regulator with XRE-family HTH domain